MAIPVDSACTGSLSLPAVEPVRRAGERETGRCRECGLELPLGYAGLVPVHLAPKLTAGESQR